MWRFCLAVALFALVGCEGPTGPEGPMGPAGPEGSGTYLTLQQVISSGGTASIHLPQSAGTPTTPPTMSCYISDDTQVWLLVGMDTYGGTTCGLVADGNHLDARIVMGPPGWYFRVAVVY